MTLKRLDNGEIYFGEPKWTPWDTIDCLVQIEETDEIVPFNATSFDPEDYGRELFEMISTTYATQIAPCSDEEKSSAVAAQVLSRRNADLAASDWIANKDVELENQTDWLRYRQALRDITLQEGYPFDVVYPTQPPLTHSNYSIDD